MRVSVPHSGCSEGFCLQRYLVSGACFDEILLKDVVERRVQLLSDVLDQEGATKGQTVFQVVLEVFVIQRGDLHLEEPDLH